MRCRAAGAQAHPRAGGGGRRIGRAGRQKVARSAPGVAGASAAGAVSSVATLSTTEPPSSPRVARMVSVSEVMMKADREDPGQLGQRRSPAPRAAIEPPPPPMPSAPPSERCRSTIPIKQQRKDQVDGKDDVFHGASRKMTRLSRRKAQGARVMGVVPVIARLRSAGLAQALSRSQVQTDGGELVAVGVAHIGGVEARAMRAQAGRTLVLAAGGAGGSVERVHRRAVGGDKAGIEPLPTVAALPSKGRVIQSRQRTSSGWAIADLVRLGRARGRPRGARAAS